MLILLKRFNKFWRLIVLEYKKIINNWGLGIGDWGLPNPQSPIPNPQYI